MKVTSKKTDDLNQVLTVNVAADDYMAARKKKLAELQRRAEVPGFRKGKVPASLIEKWYGENALGDAVNTVVGDALQNYIKDKKLDIIGEPLPVEEKDEQEWKAGNDFVFKFDVALTPKVSLTLDKTDEVPSYNINVTETEKKKLAEVYKKQQEGAEKPLTDEEIAKQVEGQLTMEYKQASEFRLEKDIREYCVRKAALQLPEKFLRRWLIAANEGKFTPEQIDKDFDGFLADYRWQLVMAELTSQFGIKVEEADLTEEAKNFAKYQYAMYGIANPPEDAIEGLVKNILQDQPNLQRMAENVQARKVIAAIREKITVKAKKISADKFRELK
ncbi:MAG: hypothetical protein KBS53_02900 [Bacteroidales bacterium]|nr:hypothetical protein [Candidatus Hennigimonas equi]